MAKKEKIALIGYGYWGQKLYNYLKESNNFELGAVFFPSLKNYKEKIIRKKFGNEFTSDIDAIWKNRDIPNVAIATPIDTHFEVACCALRHLKNVLVEKPLVIEKRQAIRLARMAYQRNLVLETEYTYTYSRALQHAKKIIQDGVIGHIQSVYISFQQLGRFLPYDVYLLLASHALSILDFFIPLTEFKFSAFPLMTTNRLVTGALIRFQSKKNNCRGHIDLSLHYPQRDKKVVLCGEKGTIMYTPDEEEVLSLTLYRRGEMKAGQGLVRKHKIFKFDEKSNLKNAVENFYAVVKRKRDCNIEPSLRINSVLASLRKVSQSKGKSLWN